MFGPYKAHYEEEENKDLNPLQVHRLQSGTYTPVARDRKFMRHNRSMSRRDFVFHSKLNSPASEIQTLFTPRGILRQRSLPPLAEDPPDYSTTAENTSSLASFAGSDAGSRDILSELGHAGQSAQLGF